METEEAVFGLSNAGNTCYLNSALQLLFTLGVDYSKSHSELGKVLSKILSQGRKEHYFNSHQFVHWLEKKWSVHLTHQDDSLIILKKLIQDLVSAEEGYLAEFAVTVKTALKCSLCGIESTKEDKSQTLILSKAVSNATLQEAWEKLHSTEGESLYCSNCGKTGPKVADTLYNLSKCLFVEVPYHKEGKLRLEPTATIGNRQFELIGFNVHLGNYSGGHYYAVCKRGGQWYELNDSTTSRISEREAIQLSTKHGGCLLFKIHHLNDSAPIQQAELLQLLKQILDRMAALETRVTRLEREKADQPASNLQVPNNAIANQPETDKEGAKKSNKKKSKKGSENQKSEESTDRAGSTSDSQASLSHYH